MKKLPQIIALIAFMTLMLIKPDYYIQSATKGLTLFAVTVLPALFPFYFTATLLTKIGGAEALSKIGRRPVAFLYNSPPSAAYVLTMSLLSGYPVGAAMTAELTLNGAISKRQALSICAYASTSGPVFILGTVGSAIFNDYKVGLVILLSHYLASLVNGLIYRGKKEDAATLDAAVLTSEHAVSESVTKATAAMLAVGAYIVLCGMIADTIGLAGLDNSLKSLNNGELSQALLSIIYGAVEMTRGTVECALISDVRLGAALASAIISFGGISVILQSCSFLSEAGISFWSVLLRKLTQSALAFGLGYIFSLIIL